MTARQSAGRRHVWAGSLALGAAGVAGVVEAPDCPVGAAVDGGAVVELGAGAAGTGVGDVLVVGSGLTVAAGAAVEVVLGWLPVAGVGGVVLGAVVAGGGAVVAGGGVVVAAAGVVAVGAGGAGAGVVVVGAGAVVAGAGVVVVVAVGALVVPTGAGADVAGAVGAAVCGAATELTAAPPLRLTDDGCGTGTVNAVLVLVVVLIVVSRATCAEDELPELQTRPVGCCLSSASITASIREPEPIGPVG
jgi:hypothetical protein